LADESISFVGTRMSDIVKELQYDDLQCGTGIEVGYVLATKLCKLDIKGYGLVELGGEVGMKIEEPIFVEFQDLNVRDFSKEQTKYVVHNAYTSYAIVEKLYRWH
jgi:hypothetical protein